MPSRQQTSVRGHRRCGKRVYRFGGRHEAFSPDPDRRPDASASAGVPVFVEFNVAAGPSPEACRVVRLRVNRRAQLEAESQGVATKTLPAVHLAGTTEVAMLPDLPEGVRPLMTDIAGAAREGRSAKTGGGSTSRTSTAAAAAPSGPGYIAAQSYPAPCTGGSVLTILPPASAARPGPDG